VKIILIEEYGCENKEQLERRERYWIDELQPNLNTRIPTRTDQEWRSQNKQYIKDFNRKYYQDNKEQLRQQQKEYVAKNKEQLDEYQAVYRKQSFDKIKKQKSKSWTCDNCGITIKWASHWKHLKTHQ
jgi:hypothetical protein